MKKTSIIALLIIIFDRIIKILVSKYMVIDEKISIIKDNLYIYNCHNTGAAFSLFDNSTFILMLLSIIALFFIIYYISMNNFKNPLLFGVLLGGIIGNLIDRIFLGYVIDYIGISVLNFYFPIFNLADAAIVISALVLVVRK